MRLPLIALLVLTGCASYKSDTKSFAAAETKLANECLAPAQSLPFEARLVVSPKSGRSPMTEAAWCYKRQVGALVKSTAYHNGPMVTSFSDYLTRLADARDRGLVDTSAALNAYSEASATFRASIAASDVRLESKANDDLSYRLLSFASAMAALSAEQARQQQANRPVMCHLTGVYVQNTIVCR